MMTVGLRPAALGPGDLGPAAQDTNVERARQMVAALAAATPAAGPAQTAQAVTPPDGAPDSARVAERALPPELIAPQPPAEAGPGMPEGPRPATEPAGPLKSYAQIPMEVMQEITRLREAAAEAQAAGIPGRNDPTPMPARPEAIGAGMPYGAA